MPSWAVWLYILAYFVVCFGILAAIIAHENRDHLDEWQRTFDEWRRSKKRQKVNGNRHG